MSRLLLATAMALVSLAAGAQGGDFRYIRFNDGNTELDAELFRVTTITDGADITLSADREGLGDRMRIRANTINIRYVGDTRELETVDLNQNVIVEHPDFTVTAAEGAWNFVTGKVVFQGNPVLTSPEIGEITGDTIRYDANSGKVNVLNTRSRDFIPVAGAEQSTPGKLTISDIQDWPALITQLQQAIASEDLTPGKRVIASMDQRVADLLPGVDNTEPPSETNQGQMVQQLNRVLENPNLYSAEAWSGRAVPAEAEELINRGPANLSPAEVVLLNRRLLEAAFPGAIAPYQP